MAGTVTEVLSGQGSFGQKNETRIVTLTCVADAADGSIPATTLSDITVGILKDGYALFKGQVIPGATAPTADSDLYLKDSNGIDLLGSAGVDQIAAATPLEFLPLIGTNVSLQPITDALVFSVANNSVNSATFKVLFVFVKLREVG